MALSKNQRFGLISFFILLAAAILVTVEPWKASTSLTGAGSPGGPPPMIPLNWDLPENGHPLSPYQDTVISYKGFDLAYNEEFEQASWVAYVLTRMEVDSGNVPRSDNFRSDTSIPLGSASLADYRGSGFDRGHLAPAGDMKWDRMAMSESFLMSNMSPQNPSFNRGIWKKLEEKVRDWAVAKDSIYVITGPALNTVQASVGKNSVGVPGYYFKVLADLSPPDQNFVAFLLPNERSSADILDYMITVDSLESFTGLDFFAAAPDQDIISWLEQNLETSSWK